MASINQISTSVLLVLEQGAIQSTTDVPRSTATLPSSTALSQTPTSASPSATSSMASTQSIGGSNSPVFLVVLGVAFAGLLITVGLRQGFRYRARNRALRNGEDADPINLENMSARPHLPRFEKKLMAINEVNERFPLSTYKNWVAARAREGLSTNGGVGITAPPSHAASLQQPDAVFPASMADAELPDNSVSKVSSQAEVATTENLGKTARERDSTEAAVAENEAASPIVEEHRGLQEVQTTNSAVNKHDDPLGRDEEEHEARAAPELVANSGDSCAICLSTLEQDYGIRGLTCGHAFHAGCLDPWLTSRRACCPLCKADYYVPKPHPEGEAAGSECPERRSRIPQPPPSTWTGIRSNHIMFPARFIAAGCVGDGVNYGSRESRPEMRESRAVAAISANGAVPYPASAQGSDAAGPRRWGPRISNPFRVAHIPATPVSSRARRPDPAAEAPMEPSPSRLEAGAIQ